MGLLFWVWNNIYFNFRVFELLSAPLRRCCYLEFKAMKSGHHLLLNNILDLIESLEPTVYLPFYTDALHKLLGIFLTIISVRIIFYHLYSIYNITLYLLQYQLNV